MRNPKHTMCRLLYHKWITTELETLAAISSPYYDINVYCMVKHHEWAAALSVLQSKLERMTEPTYHRATYEIFHQMVLEIVTNEQLNQ